MIVRIMLNTTTLLMALFRHEFKASDKLSLIGGLRYDKNNIYASAFSPKLAIHYKSSKAITLNASIGRGFKAPDFRQLYLNFTNTAAGSYSVFGALEAQTQVALLDKQGQIQSYENDYYKLTTLQPEFSTGINVGAKILLSKNTFIETNIFRNDIENLIDNRLIAYYKNGAQIFSYLNVKNAYTQGFEVNASHKLNKSITITSGYQYLETADKDQIEDIKKGLVYTKDANGVSRKMLMSEYFGLPNRSKHMANFKLLYEKNNFFFNTRIIYKSKWAVNDKDGNGLYNTNDEFAKGFIQLNSSIGHQFNQWSVQTGCDNILDYSDINNLPNMAGRTFYISLKYQITNKKNKK